MPDLPDNYQAYYQDKLWNLIPAIYRTLDTDTFNANGPLREMVNRIGAQAANLRRSIDRLWEDQSIETCDDWVIAYIGDLLATNLVASLDARGQRLDVAKTIYYRRRKGTLAILEEIASDITGWNAHVVEFFRRMGRTRHNFDPPIGTPARTWASTAQLAATGNGATATFNAALVSFPVQPGKLEVSVAGVQAGTDDSNGKIQGGGLSGTINYATGSISLTFTVAPASGAAITVQYNYLSYDLTLQVAEGLIGSLTGSQIGGWADLRNYYGAAKAQTAFDEFAHTADFRLGVDKVGWHNISHLGVFLWRLTSFGVDQTTPVASLVCSGQYSFDPTGREIPLFAAAFRTSSSYGDNWVSPPEWQLPGEIATPLLQSALLDPAGTQLYAAFNAAGDLVPNSLGIYTNPGTAADLLDPSKFLNANNQSLIYPERGCFHGVSGNGPYSVTYHYGFSSNIGAGPFDRRLPGVTAVAQPAPLSKISAGSALTGTPPVGTVQIQDSFTYAVSDVPNIGKVTIQAAQQKRPVLRLPAPTGGNVSAWTLTGSGSDSVLVLDGLLVSGGDIVVAGQFASVTFTCCTLDPGNVSTATPPVPGEVFDQGVDKRDLLPCRLWIEAEIATLTLDRCITGPVHTRNGGSVETLSANDSIIQGIRTSDPTQLLTADDIQDPVDLAQALLAQGSLASFLLGKLSKGTKGLNAWSAAAKADPTALVPPKLSSTLIGNLVTDLNKVVQNPIPSGLFNDIALSPATTQLLASAPTAGPALIQLNRMLLEEAFPVAFAQAALALGSGEVELSRVTVLGRTFVHRIEASECILDDFAVVEDMQHGCVRFTAFSVGSELPRQYECVQIAAQSSIFTSRAFGQPGYGQLLASADAAIPPPAGGTILEGAQNGSEMGAFALELNPIKERSILIKYQEYMPLGLAPVLVCVT